MEPRDVAEPKLRRAGQSDLAAVVQHRGHDDVGAGRGEQDADVLAAAGPPFGQDPPPRLHVAGGEAVARVDPDAGTVGGADGFQPAERARIGLHRIGDRVRAGASRRVDEPDRRVRQIRVRPAALGRGLVAAAVVEDHAERRRREAADVRGDPLVAVEEPSQLDSPVREAPMLTAITAVLYAGVVTVRRPMSGS